MPALRRTRPRHSALDMDEIAVNRFLVHNARAYPVLKGEGVISGRLFELTTWRREGLLARLRARGFAVRTLLDRIDALPAPPAPPPIGAAAWRPLGSSIEHFSWFDIIGIRWCPIEPVTREGVAGVLICDGWVLRRRKGRAAAAFYLAFRERGGGIGLRPLDQTTAVLTGYAQAVAHDPRPWMAERRGDDMLLSYVELPPSYREMLDLLARDDAAGWLIEPRTWPLAQALFGRLGVRLTVEA